MRNADPTPATRSCDRDPDCDYEIVSDSALIADLSLATHTVTEHASLSEYVALRQLVRAYEEMIGPLNGPLLRLAAQEALQTPTPILSLVPVDEDGSWYAAATSQEVRAA